jgi:hypothetical protein
VLTKHVVEGTLFKLVQQVFFFEVASINLHIRHECVYLLLIALPIDISDMIVGFSIITIFLRLYWIFYGGRFEEPRFDIILSAG